MDLNKMLNSNCNLSFLEERKLKLALKNLNRKLDKIESKLLKYSMLLNYNQYKKDGFSQEDIRRFYKQDKKILLEAKKAKKRYNNNKDTMFGYPANMIEVNYLEMYLRNIDIQFPFLNNCGDVYNLEHNSNNYKLDTKKIEYKIVNLICKNLGLSEKKYFGYITTGGTEGNFYGIKQGIEKFSNGIVYYSEKAHYSISKFLNISDGKQLFDNKIIASNKDGTINEHMLLTNIKEQWLQYKKPAIVVLTFGTTEFGSIDDIEKIISHIKRLQIPYYIHLDAAFYGGIPENQEGAPLIKNLKKLEVDSISVSLHKYIGCILAGGVVLRKKEKTNGKYISYLGQKDTTFLGSRSILPFSTYYHVNNLLNRSNHKDYLNNIIYFENKLIKNHIRYSRYKNGNIFILSNISKMVASKYQLAPLKEKGKYHVIIMPFQKRKKIDQLIKDIINSN